jgi:transposase
MLPPAIRLAGSGQVHEGKLIFAQVMDHLPMHTFRRCVERYEGNKSVKSFSCSDQFRCMAFAQFTWRESLRDIETCLRAQSEKLYHMGIRGGVARATLSDANETRDWRIYAEFAKALIDHARRLYADDDFGVELDGTAYALDTTTIDLCLSLFPWAHFRRTKAAVKLHTAIDLRGSIPTVVHIDDGKSYDTDILDVLTPEAGAFYIMDRGFFDLQRLYRLAKAGAFFVIRAKTNLRFRRIYSHAVSKESGVMSDQTIALTGKKSIARYPDQLRRVRYYHEETDKTLTFLSNNFMIPALTIADLYRSRWQIELFFKWIKQNLRIKAFYGTSENAVKTQIWIAVAVYVLIAILKKQLKLEASMHTILQILSITMFEKMPLEQVLGEPLTPTCDRTNDKQLKLFD